MPSNLTTREQKRQEVLEAVLKLPLPDAVFKIIYYNERERNVGPGPSGDPVLFREIEWAHSIDDAERWMEKARCLIKKAYHVGDALLRRDGTYDGMRVTLETENPGFSKETYETAVSYGCYQAR